MSLRKMYKPAFQCFILLAALIICSPLSAQDAKFTVVIDAGHGGHDSGAVGAISREKDINLSVTLLLGELINKNFKDVKVVYTRVTDKYLTLQERADIVNNNHADLFICVHTNANESSAAYGAETFTLGLAKSKANLDVAMRENSVITLEDNYKTKYQGFDPQSVDSYIMFEFMQDKYIDRSIDFASTIQKQFVNYCRRSDRGVRQAGFWVLHRSACPSVLIELGFISNPAEERYLSSDYGKFEVSTAIYNAFVTYKRSHDKKSGIQSALTSGPQEFIKDKEKTTNETDSNAKPIATETKEEIISEPKNTATPEQATKPEEKKEKTKNNNNTKVPKQETNPQKASTSSEKEKADVLVYKVQLFAAKTILKSDAPDFKNIQDVDYFVENGFYKYTVGSETDYKKILEIRKKVLSKFPDAFIIKFIGDKKVKEEPATSSKTEMEDAETKIKSDNDSENQKKSADESPKESKTHQTTTKQVNEQGEKPVFKVQLFASKSLLSSNMPEFKNVSDVEYYLENGLYKYTVGNETDYKKILEVRKKILSKFPDAFIIGFVGDKKLSPQEVNKLSK